MAGDDGATMRGNELDKEIDTYQGDFTGQTQFFTVLSPDVIEKELVTFLKEQDFERSVDTSKYTMTFSYKAHQDKVELELDED
jgi:hypothetical protein